MAEPLMEDAVPSKIPNGAVTDDLDEMKSELRQALDAFESQRSLLDAVTIKWKAIESYLEEKQRLLSVRESAVNAKESVVEELYSQKQKDLEAREAAATLRTKELREAALAAVAEERAKASVATTVSPAVTPGTAGRASLAATLKASSNKKSSAAPSGSAALEAALEAETGGFGSSKEARPELKAFCEQMDAPGLLKYLLGLKREIHSVRDELPSALLSASDPALLLLKVLESYPIGGGNEKKESESATRMSMVVLLDSFFSIINNESVKSSVASATAQDSAMKLANQWTSSWNESGLNAFVDARAILLLLGVFGIGSEFSAEVLLKYASSAFQRRWQAKNGANACRAIGLADKLPGFVQVLVKEGKQIDALRLARDFGILDNVQPVQLLRSYLKDVKKAAQAIMKSGKDPVVAANESSQKEMAGLNMVLKCIAEFGLEPKFPSAPLRLRVEQLDKARKERKKRPASAADPQAKRAKVNDGPRAKGVLTLNPSGANQGQGPRPRFGAPLSIYQTQQLGQQLASYAPSQQQQPAGLFGAGASYERGPSGGGVQYLPNNGDARASLMYATEPSSQSQPVYASTYVPGAIYASQEQYGTNYVLSGGAALPQGSYQPSYGQ
eukprot:TRINITY_DN29444_c0_g1_i1.p1 TRINITY_DN29444_c0_g1~~TRINITY_DN29444_c0_g1_i1.p1  ORF type:complete len:651 (+),score=114.29 TRINITY_DN29444_c0_g1_i1:103-1953(+)